MEGMSYPLQVVGYVLPFAHSTAALKRILANDSSINNTYMALVVSSIWIVTSILMSFWLINKKK